MGLIHEKNGQKILWHRHKRKTSEKKTWGISNNSSLKSRDTVPLHWLLYCRAADDEKKMVLLAEQLKEAQKMAEDADKNYDDAAKKMVNYENALEISDERASTGEFKIIELEEELKVVVRVRREVCPEAPEGGETNVLLLKML